MNKVAQSLTNAFFSAAYLFCTRKYLASRLSSVMCVQDSWEIEAHMPQILRLLRARPDLSGPDGQSALSSARHHFYPDLMRKIINGGAKVDALDSQGQTQLVVTGICGSPELAAALLDGGANINAQDKNGKTALMWASHVRHEMVEFLLARGADLDVRDNKGLTADDYAAAPEPETRFVEMHEKCRQHVAGEREKRDTAKRAHESYLAEGLPATQPVTLMKRLTLTRKGSAATP